MAAARLPRILKHLTSGQQRAHRVGRRKANMKTKLLAVALLAGGSMFAQTRFSIGVSVGGYDRGYYPQAPPAYASAVPPCPGPDYTWVDGYWWQNYGRNTWVAGYWNRQPFSSGYQVAPRFDHRFNEGDR